MSVCVYVIVCDWCKSIYGTTELTFFLGLQLKHEQYGIFISQIKYARELVKKYRLHDTKHCRIPMSPNTKLSSDLHGKMLMLLSIEV